MMIPWSQMMSRKQTAKIKSMIFMNLGPLQREGGIRYPVMAIYGGIVFVVRELFWIMVDLCQDAFYMVLPRVSSALGFPLHSKCKIRDTYKKRILNKREEREY
jgi:hypothetical protein